MKIVTIVGARPQFIKAAAVSREIQKHADVDEVIVHTGQHFDANMSEVFFNEMEIPKPNYNLEINSLSHGAMTGRMLEGIEEILIKESPDFLLVYGDTNSTLAGALAAKKLQIRVVHVEAGLRSFNMTMPEEINRILTDRISDVLFCPTDKSIENLTAEGYGYYDCRYIKVGDVMQDAALYYSKTSKEKSSVVANNNLKEVPFALTTLHRQENTDDIEKLKSIVNELNEIHLKQLNVVMPLHPRTKKIIESNSIKVDFITIPPVGYFDMIELIQNAQLVITDSGGLQKEAFFFKKPCITVREQTEWVELIEGGFNKLIPAGKIHKLSSTINEFKEKDLNYSQNLYGEGYASALIVNELKAIFQN